jgi:hypothetical protein
MIEATVHNFDNINRDHRPPHDLRLDRMRTCHIRIGPIRFGAAYSDLISWSAYFRIGRVTVEAKGRSW